METALLTPLSALETSLNTLITSLTTTTTFTSAPRAAQALVDADTALDTALITLHRHQRNHAEILRLRAEKDALTARLKHTVLECVRFRKLLGEIDRRIVDESDTEDEEEARRVRPVDYETLLGFGMRIGRYNARSAVEAEREAREGDQQLTINGSHAAGEEGQEAATGPRPTTGVSTQTKEAQAILDRAKNTRIEDRWRLSVPYPESMILRNGLLGKWQILRENGGEEAVELEAYNQVVRSELRGRHAAAQVKTEGPASPDERGSGGVQSHGAHVQHQRPQQPRPPKAQINLDFPPDSDDDDDDDE